MKITPLLAVIALMAVTISQPLWAQELAETSTYKVIELSPQPGFPFKASLFAASKKQATLFVPGNAFPKESWHQLAHKLQQRDIASMCLDARSYNAIKTSLTYLRQQGYTKIAIIGGSLGGGAALDVVSEEDTSNINKLLVLAPYGGSPIKHGHIDKLFIVASKDALGLYDSVVQLHDRSVKPKKLIIVDAKAHAQHLFKTTHKNELEQKIIEFIVK